MPKLVDHDAQREEVLAATWRTIANHGLARATIRRIAQEAEISTGFITHYFQSKAEVLAAALRLSNERTGARVRSMVGPLRGRAALEAAIEAVLPIDDERRLEWVIRLAFWGRSAGNEALAQEQRASREGWTAAVTEFLGQAQGDGEISSTLDAAYEAERLVALVAGIGLQSELDDGRAFKTRSLSFIETHLDGLTKPAPSRPAPKGKRRRTSQHRTTPRRARESRPASLN